MRDIFPKCYYVLVHGQLVWRATLPATAEAGTPSQPTGFYCHRYVLASSANKARNVAFRRVRDNLDRQTGWLKTKAARVELEAEEIAQAPLHWALKRVNRGHTFYLDESETSVEPLT